MAYIVPSTGNYNTTGYPLFPDIVTGPVPSQSNGQPIFPGTQFKGPMLVGQVKDSDGTGNLAGVGEEYGTSNTGFAVVAQSCVVNQKTNTGTAGQFACPIVIPAQSQILRITLMVTAIWTGAAATFGVGSSASATAFTTAGAATGGTLGPVSITPGANATQIGNWDNVGSTDVQIVLLATNTGNGVGTLTVEYIPGINLLS